MNTHPSGLPRIPDWRLVLLSVLVLLICLFYTYAAAYLAPYPGIDFDADLIVRAFEPCEANAAWCEANQNTLQIGDQLLVISDLSYEEPWRDRSRTPFGGHNPGDLVPITFRRDGEERTVHWQMLGPTDASRTSRLMRSLLLYAPFWLAGTIILLFLQPRDLRWRLLVLFNYVTAIWLAAGIYSDLRVAYTSPVQHAFAWLLALASLHLHLNVPSPLLRRHQRYVLPPLYAIAAVLAVLELFQTLPGTAFYLGLFLAFLGCFGPLVFRLLARPFVADRLAVRLMLAGISLGLGPGIILAIIPALLGASLPAGLALNVVEFATPLLPFFYIYAIYKRRLSGEFRANRLLSLYSFVALYATAFILVFSIGSQWLGLPDSPMVFSLIVSMVFIVAALPLRVRFQQLIDRLAYGTEHNPDDIIRVFASRIPAGLSLEALGQLLADEVAPSLLIRQSALLLLADGSPCDGDTSTVYARGVNVAETPKTLHQVEQLLGGAGQYRPPLAEARGEFDWVRLVIPLQIREKTVGGWLFGRRDPDDYYPQDDIMLLTALASQVAVAIENAQLAAEALRESEEKYRNVVERANDGITIIQDTTVKYANPRLAEMWGGIAEEIVDTPFADYVHPSELLKAADRYKRRMAGEDVAPVYETVLRRKDSGKVYVELNAGVITYQGKPADLVIVRDITERKQAEEVLRKARDELEMRVQERTAELAQANETLQAEIIERKRAEEELQHTLAKLRKALGGIIQAMALTVEARDPYTAGHQRRVSNLARAIGEEMGISEEQIDGIRMAGVIHDIGKMSVPAEILSKPGRLNELEYGMIETHPEIAYDILKTIEFPWPVAEIVLQHHERMNGAGYPQGLSGEDILLEARILGVADVVEAMASHRPYRSALGIDRALEEISQNRGVLYDSEVVDACLNLFTRKGFTLE